jgi:hypothetical protein
MYPMLFMGRVAPVHLFHLAPDGVYLAINITADAGALLPHRFTLTPIAGCNLFSVALSVRSPCLAVNQHRYSMECRLSSTSSRPAAIPSVDSERSLYKVWSIAVRCESLVNRQGTVLYTSLKMA